MVGSRKDPDMTPEQKKMFWKILCEEERMKSMDNHLLAYINKIRADPRVK